MAKTSKQIEGDIYRLLRDSNLYDNISGKVYRKGERPRDSQKEDAVVIFTTGLADQIQTGVVTVHIYVPDIDPYANGVFVEDGERMEAVERLAQEWVDSLTAEVSCYKFQLQQTICSEEAEDINQHYAVVCLKYKYFGDDYAPLNIPQVAVIDATDADGNKGYMPILETQDEDCAVTQPVMKKKDY